MAFTFWLERADDHITFADAAADAAAYVVAAAATYADNTRQNTLSP